MNCKPLYLAAERAYLFLCLSGSVERTAIVESIIADLHEALGLDEEPTGAWWKSTLDDRALDDKLNRKHGMD